MIRSKLGACATGHARMVKPRYNPYKTSICKYNELCDEDKLYNDDPIDFIDTVQAVSNILDNCMPFKNIDEVNKSTIFSEMTICHQCF